MSKILRFSIPLIFGCLLVCALIYLVGETGQVRASDATANLVVTTLEDEVLMDGFCSLREAIEAANTNTTVADCGTGEVVTDTITFDVAGIITVTSQLEVTFGGLLVIDGAGMVTLSGGRNVRILIVNPDTHLHLNEISLINGNEDYGGAILNYGTLSVNSATFSGNQGWAGSGINNHNTLTVSNSTFTDNGIAFVGAAFYNSGVMTVTHCTFSNNYAELGGAIGNSADLTIISSTISGNVADHYGAGISNAGSLTLLNSNIANNNAGQSGGGIYNEADGELTMINSVLSGNHTYYQAGGLYIESGVAEIIESTVYSNTTGMVGGGIINHGTLVITGSIVSANVAGVYPPGYAGGISNSSVLTITNSTVSGNQAIGLQVYPNYGGGISNSGIVDITSSTIAENSADVGGGITDLSSGISRIKNSIIANNLEDDCFPTIVDEGHNLDSDGSCGLNPAYGSIPGVDPLLGSLGDNGGPTFTHALLAGSPAIDNGDDAQCPATDQRGVLRPQDGDGDNLAICDIGSYEVAVPPNTVVVTGSGEGSAGETYTFTATVEPATATLPLYYSWEATDQDLIYHTSGLTDTVSFTWEMAGVKVITVTAGNMEGSAVGTHVITITGNMSYLPVVVKGGG